MSRRRVEMFSPVGTAAAYVTQIRANENLQHVVVVRRQAQAFINEMEEGSQRPERC